MKLAARNLAVLLALTVGLFSCKDDDGAKTKSKVTVGKDSYGITSGVFLRNLESSEDAEGNIYYKNEIMLGADGMNVSIEEGSLWITGQGSIVDVMINNKGRELQTGTYTWQAEENQQPFDLWYGSVGINWLADESIDYTLKSGTLTITKSGDKYKLVFEGVAYKEDEFGDEVPNSDVTVTFQYEGALPEGDTV